MIYVVHQCAYIYGGIKAIFTVMEKLRSQLYNGLTCLKILRIDWYP